MPLFTGSDIDGLAATANGENWITLTGEIVSHSGAAFHFLSFDNITYTNQGTILSDAFGITTNNDAENNTVVISAAGSVTSAVTGIYMGGDNARVINHGEITAFSDDGIFLNGSGGEAINAGTITAETGIHSLGGNQIINSGDIHSQLIAVQLNSAGSNMVVNHGTMLSEAFGIYSDAGDHTIVNHGYIGTSSAQANATHFAITGANGSLNITNHGIIDGGIEMTSGSTNDVFDAAGGTVIGDVFLAQGDDLVIMRQSNPGALMNIDGGVGSDTIDLSGFQSGIWLDFSYGGATIWTQDDNDASDNSGGTWREFATTANVENAIGTIGIDLMRGNDEDNTFGYVGTALIAGVERIIGLGGSDTVDFSRFASAIRVDLSLAGVEAQTQDDDDVNTGGEPLREIADLEGIENIVGTVGVDYLRGNSADNTFGYVGEASRPGLEQILGEGGTDTADFSRFESAVWINLLFPSTEAWTQDDSDASTDINAGTWRAIANLDSIENIVGTDQDDFLGGDAGANVITAGAGNDRIAGSSGADTFIFANDFAGNGAGANVLLDFSHDDSEKIDLRDVGILDFADLTGYVSDVNGTLRINDGNGLTIDLVGYTMADFGFGQIISDGDFIFF